MISFGHVEPPMLSAMGYVIQGIGHGSAPLERGNCCVTTKLLKDSDLPTVSQLARDVRVTREMD